MYDVCPKPGPSSFTNRFDMDDEAKPRCEQIDTLRPVGGGNDKFHWLTKGIISY